MAGLKEIKERIGSIKSTIQITSAMKMVSAAKLRRAQDAITQMRPYATKLQEILGNLSGSLNDAENPYTKEREVKRVLVVAIASNRGLCGGFNNNISKEVRALKAGAYANASFNVVTISKKLNDVFKKTDYYTSAGLGSTPYSVYDNLTFEESSKLAEEIMLRFAEESWDKVVLVYNSFKNAAVQIVKTEQFLPIQTDLNEVQSTSTADYIFEPDKQTIVEELVPRSLKLQFYKALRDSYASEHGARMTAMHKATDNATDLSKELTLKYNKARQAAITNEILEIVAGAEALG